MTTAANNNTAVNRPLSTIGTPAAFIPQTKALRQPLLDLPHPAIPVIVHCHLRWDFVWQRPQQIFSRLASQHRVLFLEDAMGGEGVPRLEITQPMGNIVRVVPVLPQCEGTSADTQSGAVLALLKDALGSHPLLKGQFDSPVQWFYSPMTAPSFLGQLGAVAVVYDCMDELANFRFAPPDIGERERFLLSHADLVFTGGYQLFEAKSKLHPNTHFFGCGVDAAHFGKARLAETAPPPEIAHLPGPVLGYFGVIDERLDYELLARLAASFPDASVVMVGPFAKVDPSTLPKWENIHWLGPRAYAELPAMVKAFDICLMPFAMNAATQYINPTKTLEYMASGKPVVSTAVPDVVRNFTPVVKIGYSHDEFILAVARAISQPDPASITQGLAQALAATWDTTVANMRSLMVRVPGVTQDAYAMPIAVEPGNIVREGLSAEPHHRPRNALGHSMRVNALNKGSLT